jgi:hypothetical protein
VKIEEVELKLVQTTEHSRIGYLTYKGPEFNDLRYFDLDMPVILDGVNFHLYALSNKKLKAGDLALLPDGKIKIMRNSDILNYFESNNTEIKKIVSSTNPKLKLLKISAGEAIYYIEQYNKKNIIKLAKHIIIGDLKKCPYDNSLQTRILCDSCRQYHDKKCNGILLEQIKI